MTTEVDNGDYGRRIAEHSIAIQKLEKGQDDINGKLDVVLSSLTEMRAQRGPGLMGVLNAAQALLTICTIAIGGIVYFASNGMSKDQHGAELRVLKLEMAVEHLQADQRRINEALGWRPTIARSTN